MTRRSLTAIAFATAMLCSLSSIAKELAVGPGQPLKLPSQAASVVADGDVVRIDPGTYVDCATWNASRLLIEATGPDVRLTGKTCAGKAIFITAGADITIRGITFADATVPEHNGAGIRAAGDNLTVEHSRFLHNENGILAGGGPNSVVRVTDSMFVGNGACINACAHAIYAGAPIALLDVERSAFVDTRIAHHIKSRARNTIISDNRIEDGPTGTSSYLIDIPNGGNVLIERNVLEKGALSSNRTAAISIGAEGTKNPTASLIIRDNIFINDMTTPTLFVRNSTSVAVQFSGNRLRGSIVSQETCCR